MSGCCTGKNNILAFYLKCFIAHTVTRVVAVTLVIFTRGLSARVCLCVSVVGVDQPREQSKCCVKIHDTKTFKKHQ